MVSEEGCVCVVVHVCSSPGIVVVKDVAEVTAVDGLSSPDGKVVDEVESADGRAVVVSLVLVDVVAEG